jgi:hypothetical protein
MGGKLNIRGNIVQICLTIFFILLILSAAFEPYFNSPMANQLFNNINTKVTKEFFINTIDQTQVSKLKKTQLSFSAFTDTHIGASYQYFFRIPRMVMADYLDHLGDDLVNYTSKLDFSIHLGDIINHNTAQVNGVGLPPWVNQYKNNLKAYLISHVNLPFHFVIGNHDINDYEMNEDDPHNLTKSLIDETSMNNPVYAMMRDGILFLVVPELGYITWTHPVEYEWIEFMVSHYPNATTIILSHQAIEDTTEEDKLWSYRGKQDMVWWTNLFQNNPQIKMWIHGHNHIIDWYVGNQSTGITPNNPIFEFGHEMVFSSPYAQLDWGNYHEEDRIVIYNISTTGIYTATWENNGDGGHWVSDYHNCWNISTTFDPNVKDWYSFPVFLQDNETQLTDMKLLSPNITMQLIGTMPMELFYDPYMESPNGWSDEIILGFGDDRNGNVEQKENESGMKVLGPTYITFPDKYPDNYLFDNPNLFPILSHLLEKYPNLFPIFRNILLLFQNSNQEDGRSGQPYRCFQMGTICAAVANQTYNFTMTARSNSGEGRFKMNVSCCDWKTKSQYSILPGSEKQVFSHTFGSNYETIYATYTVPNNNNAWFLQGKLNFLDSTDYDVSLFSVKRQRSSDTTDDFHLYLSGDWYNVSTTLQEDETVNFSIYPQNLCDIEGVMNFTAFINGNKYGMVNMIYHEPILLSRNARFKVNSYSNGVFNLTLTKTISRNSKVFKMFPFSTDSMYKNLNIIADDGSGMKHCGRNGNLWLSCNSPDKNHRFVEVIL